MSGSRSIGGRIRRLAEERPLLKEEIKVRLTSEEQDAFTDVFEFVLANPEHGDALFVRMESIIQKRLEAQRAEIYSQFTARPLKRQYRVTTASGGSLSLSDYKTVRRMASRRPSAFLEVSAPASEYVYADPLVWGPLVYEYATAASSQNLKTNTLVGARGTEESVRAYMEAALKESPQSVLRIFRRPLDPEEDFDWEEIA